jgi:hypothetical protein
MNVRRAAYRIAFCTSALMLIAAAPLTYGSSLFATTGIPAPSPATPPADPGFEPAPVPNLDVTVPRDRATNDNQATLRPNLFTNKTQWQGDGYVGNSTAQIQQEGKMRPGAGFSLSVPVQ